MHLMKKKKTSFCFPFSFPLHIWEVHYQNISVFFCLLLLLLHLLLLYFIYHIYVMFVCMLINDHIYEGNPWLSLWVYNFLLSFSIKKNRNNLCTLVKQYLYLFFCCANSFRVLYFFLVEHEHFHCLLCVF